VEPEPVGSGSARDDCSAVPQAEDCCVPAAQDDSSGDEAARAGCSAESAGYSVELPADDSARGGYSVDSSRDDCLVVSVQADAAVPADDCSAASVQADSAVPADDCSAVSVQADSAVPADDCPVAPRVDDSSPGDCSAVPQADSAVAPDDCLVAPRADDSFPGDCSAVAAPVDSAALMVDDSAVRERPHPDARSGLADFLAGSPVG
jgi:hypothetical protein